jgi:hypothetical protein
MTKRGSKFVPNEKLFPTVKAVHLKEDSHCIIACSFSLLLFVLLFMVYVYIHILWAYDQVNKAGIKQQCRTYRKRPTRKFHTRKILTKENFLKVLVKKKRDENTPNGLYIFIEILSRLGAAYRILMPVQVLRITTRGNNTNQTLT